MKCSDGVDDIFCVRCYLNVRGRGNYKGHRGYRKPRVLQFKDDGECPVKKPSSSPTKGVPEGKPMPGDTFSRLCLLWSYLTDDVWEDGSSRQRATLLLTMDGGVAKVWLNDRATGRSAWSAGETADEALLALEEALATDTVSWRLTPPPVKKR